jgi:uncharacterized protein (DUF58 family)
MSQLIERDPIATATLVPHLPPAVRHEQRAEEWRRFSLMALWNRNLPAHVTIRPQLIWPLLLLPIVILNQLVTPHPIWVVLLVTLVGLYGIAIGWVRGLAEQVTVQRKRVGTILVAGDQLEEEFVLTNTSALPILWAEVRDASTMPDYQPGRVVGCGGNNSYRWNSTVICRRRGVYRLGPHQLHLADPLGFFSLTIDFSQSDTVVIYPRVLRLPTVLMPQGNQSGTARRRRPLLGVQPAATVRAYQPTDTLRHVHWPITAHRGALMVKEMESEPSGTVWIVLDLDEAVQQGSGEAGTLEYSIIVAASLTAELLQDDERRAVGLITISGRRAADQQAVLALAPQSGQAHLWTILAALAPVQATDVTLAELLHSARVSLGKRSTAIVVTAQPTDTQLSNSVPPWLAELVHLQGSGISSSVVLVTAAEPSGSAAPFQALLSRYGIDLQLLSTQQQLPPALTFRRTRRVIRSTPTGGAISYEIEEEVG